MASHSVLAKRSLRAARCCSPLLAGLGPWCPRPGHNSQADKVCEQVQVAREKHKRIQLLCAQRYTCEWRGAACMPARQAESKHHPCNVATHWGLRCATPSKHAVLSCSPPRSLPRRPVSSAMARCPRARHTPMARAAAQRRRAPLQLFVPVILSSSTMIDNKCVMSPANLQAAGSGGAAGPAPKAQQADSTCWLPAHSWAPAYLKMFILPACSF